MDYYKELLYILLNAISGSDAARDLHDPSRRGAIETHASFFEVI